MCYCNLVLQGTGSKTLEPRKEEKSKNYWKVFDPEQVVGDNPNELGAVGNDAEEYEGEQMPSAPSQSKIFDDSSEVNIVLNYVCLCKVNYRNLTKVSVLDMS